jgi:predicted oxidoreductase
MYSPPVIHDADVAVVGAGLAGLVATAELADAGRRVVVLEQENEASLGGQAFWSLGGLFFVNSPEQRWAGIRDSHGLALQDWMGTAGFDREEDLWPRRWAEAYVDFASGEKRAWLRAQGLGVFPIVQWAERGGHLADGPGNAVPRFHVTWGSGPGVLEPFVRRVREAEGRGLVSLRFRHRATHLTKTAGAVDGVKGDVLAPSDTARGVPSSRQVVDDFTVRAGAVVVTSGGIGANQELVRRYWPPRLGRPPAKMIQGVPDYVDGSMLGIAEAAGGRIINRDRMWHYPEGIQNYAPIWSHHGIRILSGPSPLWLDATGNRLPVPLFPGCDTLGALTRIVSSGRGHSWFLLNRRIIKKEFALSGSEQNPDLTNRSILGVLLRALTGSGNVREFERRGADFVVRDSLSALADGMNQLTGERLIEPEVLEREVWASDRDVASGLGKDAQLATVVAARRYRIDRLVRVTSPRRLLDPDAGPLIAVRLWILTRKTLGGLQTDLSGRVLQASGEPLPGLYAAGEVAGFGGGGMHGYRALEGTFLGGCLFSGRTAGRAAAAAVG